MWGLLLSLAQWRSYSLSVCTFFFFIQKEVGCWPSRMLLCTGVLGTICLTSVALALGGWENIALGDREPCKISPHSQNETNDVCKTTHNLPKKKQNPQRLSLCLHQEGGERRLEGVHCHPSLSFKPTPTGLKTGKAVQEEGPRPMW